MRPEEILHPRPEGLYCAPGDFYIDPVRPVDRALITHGHSDHARAGHGLVMATAETLAIMAARYGADFAGARECAAYGEARSIGDAQVRFVPAGHVLGSAQIVVEAGGKRIVVSGDYKRRRDPTCPAFEPIACDVFVTEATFALPVFRHPDDRAEIAKLLRSIAQQPERAHLVGAYALGKAQRIIALLREAGYGETIYLHGAMEGLCALYERCGVPLGPLAAATTTEKRDFAGAIVICPPAAMADRWSRRFPDPVACFASGWMRVKQRAKRSGVELPLVISDHADWDELTGTIKEIAPGEVWITHGRDDALARWAALNGLAARPLRLVGFDDEDD
ncbi:MAG: ligase-associated DNA damage response exonuclease [Hydrogenophilaceae bacterium]|jgi:putative mRNA 3-end processing factor|nr:ligase-associated DNA damage response exonuclease [Hydrogenophilaceae bacterium]